MPRKNSTNWSVSDQISATRLQNLNSDIDDLYSSGSDRFSMWVASGLTVNIGAGSWRVGSASGTYAGGTALMTASSTNYVMLDNTGAIQLSTVGWNSLYARIGVVVTGVSTITTITIWRPDLVGGDLGGGGITTKTSRSNNTVYQATSKGGILVAAINGGSAYNIIVYSDASNPPTTVVGVSFVYSLPAQNSTVTVPILPNHYYKTTGCNLINFYD